MHYQHKVPAPAPSNAELAPVVEYIEPAMSSVCHTFWIDRCWFAGQQRLKRPYHPAIHLNEPTSYRASHLSNHQSTQPTNQPTNELTNHPTNQRTTHRTTRRTTQTNQPPDHPITQLPIHPPTQPTLPAQQIPLHVPLGTLHGILDGCRSTQRIGSDTGRCHLPGQFFTEL